MPLSHPPGHAQCDFGEAVAVIAGVERKVHYLVLDLPHSDGCFMKAYPAETTEAFLDGHVSAFAFLGGIPRACTTTPSWHGPDSGRRPKTAHSNPSPSCVPLPVRGPVRPSWQTRSGSIECPQGARLRGHDETWIGTWTPCCPCPPCRMACDKQARGLRLPSSSRKPRWGLNLGLLRHCLEVQEGVADALDVGPRTARSSGLETPKFLRYGAGTWNGPWHSGVD